MNTNDIKKVQAFLKLPETGLFDEYTEAGIRNYQLKNGMEPIGLIDFDLLRLIGVTSDEERPDDAFASTDVMEMTTHWKTQVPIKYMPLNKNEYFKASGKKQWLFLHHTAGWHNPLNVVSMWEGDTRGKIGTQFVIGGPNCQTLDGKFDGQIIQCMPDYESSAWHLGIGDVPVHRNSIGVELCNFGFLVPDGKLFRTYDIINAKGQKQKGYIVDPREVVDLKREFRGFRYYHRYSDNQLTNLQWLIQKISSDTGIDVTEGLRHRLMTNKDPHVAFEYNVDVVRGKIRGLNTHTNVSQKNRFGNWEKWDLSPQPNLIDMILSL